MDQTILVNKIELTEEETTLRLQKIEPSVSFNVDKLIYYPYYFFEYTMDKEGLFVPLKGSVACTIDCITGVGALIDKAPVFDSVPKESDKMIEKELDIKEAEKEAQAFIHRTISLKMKIFKMPRIRLTRQELFYRPYWVVQGKGKEQMFELTVDAMSGKYHPL